ncbi:MAG: hypothetical protein ISS78_06560 [Phycisphaerae bacterium]|nr:hypothetical protein [Phycisphaerae bacterium]
MSGVRLDAELAAVLREAGLDTVEGAFAWQGGTDLDKPGLGTRRRTRLVLAGGDGAEHELYLKRYGVEPPGQRVRRLLTYGRRSPARIEYDNVRAAGAAGVATMGAVACGDEMGLLAARRSFVIVTAVPGDALERCGEVYLAADAARGAELAEKLADLVGALHAAGAVHRDLYAAHVFLHEGPEGAELYLIDLARMFTPPRWRRFRWRVKDLAQLKYSMPRDWVADHWEAFCQRYFARAGVDNAGRYAAAIDRKVGEMRRRDGRRSRRNTEAGV